MPFVFYPERRIERFWRKVDMSAGPNACWPWLGARQGNELYGKTSWNMVQMGAHVLALKLYTNEEPDGRQTLHACDNGLCCNPAHLRWGSIRDNFDDARVRRRMAGERNGFAKLTCDAVQQIRSTRGKSQRSLAREFGVSQQTISRVVTRQLWGDV